MNRKLSTLLLACSICSLSASELSGDSLIRTAPLPQPPVIDGKIDKGEWNYATGSFGGVSPYTKLMTYRLNNFKVAYTEKGFYFSIISEAPRAPQKLSAKDMVEIQLLPPGAAKAVSVKFDCSGKGSYPAGVKIANSINPDLLNSMRGNCWISEVFVPAEALKVKSIADQQTWGLQMIRHWDAQAEKGYWHLPTPNGRMGTFITDKNAPAVSFDGFGHEGFRYAHHYRFSYRVENITPKPLKVLSKSYFVGIEGAPTLDINNPDLLGNAKKLNIRSNQTLVKPGEKLDYSLYTMSHFPGKPRLIFSHITSVDGKTTYYKRSMFWDLRKALMTAVFTENKGLPYLNVGFYPSYGNKFRFAVTFNKKLPCVQAQVAVKNEAGKVLKKFEYGDKKKVLEDIAEETALPGLELGKYIVELKAFDSKGNVYTHERTFAVAKFPWQNLNIGKERVIVPPFKPLKHNASAREVHALLTGYQLGEGLWSNIIAENEKIMAGPVQLFVQNEPCKTKSIKLVSAEKDRIVYEIVLQYKNLVTLNILQEYDYDGFCKATIRVTPRNAMIINSFKLQIPMLDKYAKYYNVLTKSGSRAKEAPALHIPAGEGDLALSANGNRPSQCLNYFWFGDNYKGFCWMIDSDKNYYVDRNKYNYHLRRQNGKVTFTLEFVNKRNLWKDPFELTIGFQPTPVKPQNEKFRRIGEKMYNYDEPAGCDFAPMSVKSNIISPLNYPVGVLPNNDRSYFKFLFDSRNNPPTAKERIAFADDYIKRNKKALEEDFPLVSPEILHRTLRDWRMYGPKYFLLYHDPALYSCQWDEAEMYKAEWCPALYAVDDAQNEYYSNICDSYLDKLLYEMRNEARMGFDGMNFDCFPLGGGFNEVAGNAFRVRKAAAPFLHNDNMLRIAPQGMRPGQNLFQWRELCKRTAHMLYTENKLVYGVPWVDLHATHCQAVPITAFCATTITHERSSGGGEYYDRFPDSFLQADTLGTQSGIIPKVIVSTRAVKKGVTKEDELKTLISMSFAYGLMNIFDQGVFIKSKEYQLSRDYPFTFGYGSPECQTLPFYGKTPQPVKCSNPQIKTTQVIRKDGKVLLLIGNMGNETVAEFDLSKLQYKKYKVTDVFAKKELAAPSIKIAKRGYAMLEIEKL
ncbi:MAG: hypothetical protein IKD10_09485 [Lentisphaeria bacterium]|nr:hypothetical protein [Lentisphaeria bacterium]